MVSKGYFTSFFIRILGYVRYGKRILHYYAECVLSATKIIIIMRYCIICILFKHLTIMWKNFLCGGNYFFVENLLPSIKFVTSTKMSHLFCDKSEYTVKNSNNKLADSIWLTLSVSFDISINKYTNWIKQLDYKITASM